MKKIRLFLALIFLAALVALVLFKTEFWIAKDQSCKKCNIVLISLDTLAASHLPCYGYSKNTASNLCEYANENVVFKQAYAQSYWTLPSQTSVMTSLYPTQHKYLYELSNDSEIKTATLAQTLQSNGYDTWYFGPSTVNDASWKPTILKGFNHNLQNEYQHRSLNKWTEGLKALQENTNKGQPTFLFLHTYFVHDPYLNFSNKPLFQFIKNQDNHKDIPLTLEAYQKFTPEFYQFVIESLKTRVKSSDTPESYIKNTLTLNQLIEAKTSTEKEAAFNRMDDIEKFSYQRDFYVSKYEGSNQSIASYMASLYDERIYDLDHELEEVFNFLRNNPDISKKTIVAIYSDHGEQFTEHGDFGHCNNPDSNCLYNEVIKVPLILSVPGVKHKTINNLAQLIDIYPTLAGLVGLPKPEYLQGIDLSDQVFGKAFPQKNNYVISEQGYVGKVLITRNLSKVYVKQMNKIDASDTIEFFDLKSDPKESKNLASKNKSKIEQAKKILLDFQNLNGNQDKVDFPADLDKVKRDKLIKGGYF